MVNKTTTQKANAFIRNRADFRTHGALSGYNRETDPLGSTGQLPHSYRESFYASTYRVYSYVTPIAWYAPDTGWVRPDVKYSATTSKHQGQIPVDGAQQP